MKNKTNLKGLAVISSFALFATTGPMFAQSSSDSSQSSASQGQNSQLYGSGSSSSSGAQSSPSSSPTAPSSSSMRQSDLSSTTSGQEMNEPAGASNAGRNFSWIGLLGLAGLFGLKRHSDVNEGYRTSTASRP